MEANFKIVVWEFCNAANCKRLNVCPFGKVDVFYVTGFFPGSINQFKKPGTLEVIRHDDSDTLIQRVFSRKRRNGDRGLMLARPGNFDIQDGKRGKCKTQQEN